LSEPTSEIGDVSDTDSGSPEVTAFFRVSRLTGSPLLAYEQTPSPFRRS
jgi:hypothetical protein